MKKQYVSESVYVYVCIGHTEWSELWNPNLSNNSHWLHLKGHRLMNNNKNNLLDQSQFTLFVLHLHFFMHMLALIHRSLTTTNHTSISDNSVNNMSQCGAVCVQVCHLVNGTNEKWMSEIKWQRQRHTQKQTETHENPLKQNRQAHSK